MLLSAEVSNFDQVVGTGELFLTRESVSGWITHAFLGFVEIFHLLCWATYIVVVPENESAHVNIFKKVHTSLHLFSSSV